MTREAALFGYAVVMDTGHFVGIWRDRDTAELVCAKQPPSHGDRVVPVYAAPQESNPVPSEPASLDKAKSLGAGNTDTGELAAGSAPTSRTAAWKALHEDWIHRGCKGPRPDDGWQRCESLERDLEQAKAALREARQQNRAGTKQPT